MTGTALHVLMIITLSLIKVKIDQISLSRQRRICFWLELYQYTGLDVLSKTTKLTLLDSLLQEVRIGSMSMVARLEFARAERLPQSDPSFFLQG